MIANLHADLTITPKSGKVLPEISKLENTLKKHTKIAHFSRVIEEKAYISYKNIGEIGYLRGVDSAYTYVNPLDKKIFFGKYPSFTYENEVILENNLDVRLGIPVGENTDYAMLMMPKPGSGMINKEEDIFNKKEIFVTGIFPSQDQLDNYIIAPIELAQGLLNLPKNSAYTIVIKLKDGTEADQVRDDLAKQLGANYNIKTKKEENAAFWKMINTEKLMIYLIFSLVIFITTFNLAGAITILQLDKKEQSKALISLGFSRIKLRRIYFYTGLLIVGLGIICGLIIGTLICYIQINTGIFKANASLPFPVKITFNNYLIVALITLIFGISISWIFSKINKNLLKT